MDAHPGAPREVLLSYAFWGRRYNADPTVIGRSIMFDGEPYTIVGIAPDGYTILVNSAAHTIAPALYPNLSFNPATDFSAVAPPAGTQEVAQSESA